MNILVLSQRWYPDTFGGSEHVASEQARRLAIKGHNVIAITERSRENLPYDKVEDKVRVIRFGTEKQLARLGGSSRTDMQEVERELRKIKTTIKFDVAIIHHPFVGEGFLRANIKIPYLYVFHASTAKEAHFEGVKREFSLFFRPFEKIFTILFVKWIYKIERKVLLNASKVGVFSEFSRKVLLGFVGAKQRNIMKLTIGIRQDLFNISPQEKARKKLGLPLDKKILLTVRRFTPRMGIKNLIRAMKQVDGIHPDAQLLIIGEGPLKASLQSEIERNKLQNKVILIGAVPLKDLPLYYQSSDLFVLPTEAFEGLGMSTLEALATGIPVVGTPAGATPEVISALDPTLITDGVSVNDIANGINNFLNRPQEEQEKLRIKARKVVEKYYRWDKAIDELEKVLKTL